ncbi:uncharacterized protein LOC105396764 [Plutella xylostella]|uniref:uncharacterized protein LOC105396764 n=1 Tax=Plutella xylostella TaxID=51655 RepID=UPI0020323AAA|nr:uncharacterized protein LOC105396764 [Plutella xylostella]
MSILKSKLFETIAKSFKSDAVPKPPREPVETTDTSQSNTENQPYNVEEEEIPEPEKPKKEKKNPKPTKKTFFNRDKTNKHDDTRKHTKSGKDQTSINTQATGDVIHVVNSKDVQVGHQYVYNMGTPGANSQKNNPFDDEETVEKTNLITLVMEAKIMLEHEYMDYVSKNLGRNWHSFFRTLGFTRGRIETVELDEGRNGVAEVRYKLLLEWARTDEDPTLGRLATRLWDEGERQTVKELAVLYSNNFKQQC